MIVGELARVDQLLGQWAAAKLRGGHSVTDIVLIIREAVKVSEGMEHAKPDYLPRFGTRKAPDIHIAVED